MAEKRCDSKGHSFQTVNRRTEWRKEGKVRVVAFRKKEWRRCPRCHNSGSLRVLADSRKRVQKWARYLILSQVCSACGSQRIVTVNVGESKEETMK